MMVLHSEGKVCMDLEVIISSHLVVLLTLQIATLLEIRDMRKRGMHLGCFAIRKSEPGMPKLMKQVGLYRDAIWVISML